MDAKQAKIKLTNDKCGCCDQPEAVGRGKRRWRGSLNRMISVKGRGAASAAVKATRSSSRDTSARAHKKGKAKHSNEKMQSKQEKGSKSRRSGGKKKLEQHQSKAKQKAANAAGGMQN